MLYLLFALVAALASAEITCTGECTRTQGYYKNHNSQASKPSQNIPWPQTSYLPQGEDTLICGKTALQWMFESVTKHPYAKFAHQYVAALNNLGRGACNEDEVHVLQTIWDARIVPLAGYCHCAERGDCFKTPDGDELTQFASFLDGYNNGEHYASHCDDDGSAPPGGPGQPINCGGEVCRFVKICEIENQPICEPTETCEGGCTYTRGCWTYNSQGNQPCPAIVEENRAELDSRSVCGYTWTQILGYNTSSALGNGQGNVNSNTWYKLAIQTLSALLNVEFADACTTLSVQIDIEDAVALINNCTFAYPNDINGTTAMERANTLMNDLALFNEGERGPAHC